MKLNQLLTAFTLCAMMSTTAFAQAPKYSNEFLSIGVGGRAMAMSGAVAASANDATAAFWNPAGLASFEGNLQVAAMHAELFAGIAKFDYATLATRIDDKRVIAFSIIRFGTDDIPNTLDLVTSSGFIDYSRITTFSIADYSFMFSYAKQSSIPGLNFGGSAKVIHRTVGDFGQAWGFGFDLGAQYKKDKWTLGVQAKDVTSTFNAWSYQTELFADAFQKTGNEIPKNTTEITLPKLIMGAAYKWDLSTKFSALVELDADMTFDGKRNVLIGADPVSIDPHMGFEVGYNKFVFLRGGIQNIQSVKEFDGTKSTIVQPNLGIGIKLGKLTIDYALASVSSSTIQPSNIFALKLDITKHSAH